MAPAALIDEAMRRMAFASPLGGHERIYDDFERIENPRWRQAPLVTPYPNSAKANEIFWTTRASMPPSTPRC